MMMNVFTSILRWYGTAKESHMRTCTGKVVFDVLKKNLHKHILYFFSIVYDINTKLIDKAMVI